MKREYGAWIRGSFVVSLHWQGYRNKTLDELDEEFQSVRWQWNRSEECKALKLQIKQLATRLPITNVVALGIGSLHETYEHGIPVRTGQQLMAVLTIRDVLSGTLSWRPLAQAFNPNLRDILC